MRRRITQILICIIIASGINVWVAQYFLLDHSPPAWVMPHWTAQEYWDRYVDASSAYGPARFIRRCAAIGCDFLVIDASPQDLGDAAPPRMMMTRAGFPLRSFEGMHSWGGVSPSHAWALPIEPRSLNVAWVSVLPYRPMPLGLVLNTAVYASMVWCAVFGPSVVVRRWKEEQRRRAQCCHRCGYDLRGNLLAGCPECGWRRENVTQSQDAAPDERGSDGG